MAMTEEGSTKLLMAGAIACLSLFAAWIVFDCTRPDPNKAQPRMAEWEVKAWASMRCDQCSIRLDPYCKADGLYPGYLNGPRKILCGKCGGAWMAQINRAKKKVAYHE